MANYICIIASSVAKVSKRFPKVTVPNIHISKSNFCYKITDYYWWWFLVFYQTFVIVTGFNPTRLVKSSSSDYPCYGLRISKFDVIYAWLEQFWVLLIIRSSSQDAIGPSKEVECVFFDILFCLRVSNSHEEYGFQQGSSKSRRMHIQSSWIYWKLRVPMC